MLEGLEISEIKKSKVVNYSLSFRTDAEFFRKEYLQDDKAIAKNGFNKLVKITNKINVGYVGSMVEYYREDGIVLLQTKNIDAFFINENNLIRVTSEFHNQLKKSQINFEDILIARSGSFGKASIYLEENVVNSSDIILVEATKELVNPYFLVAYLNSKYGINQMVRFSSGGLQGHVNLTILEELEVPKIDKAFQIKIEELIKNAYVKRSDSKKTYTKAETILLEEIGLQNFEPSKGQINIKNFKVSFVDTGRLDAEYYQVKYEDYENLIISQKHTFIKDEYLHITTKSEKDKEGYNYIEIGDVNVSDGSNKSNFVETINLPANAKTLVNKGDILISNVRPYRGAVTIINTDEKDLIVSGAFTVLRKNPKSIYNNEVLKVLLRSSVYKDWLLKFNVGTSYPVIKDEDVLNLAIPFIDVNLQVQIAELVEESFKLKAESERLLEVAKKAVEMAIEVDESTAIKFIKDNN